MENKQSISSWLQIDNHTHGDVWGVFLMDVFEASAFEINLFLRSHNFRIYLAVSATFSQFTLS